MAQDSPSEEITGLPRFSTQAKPHYNMPATPKPHNFGGFGADGVFGAAGIFGAAGDGGGLIL